MGWRRPKQLHSQLLDRRWLMPTTFPPIDRHHRHQFGQTTTPGKAGGSAFHNGVNWERERKVKVKVLAIAPVPEYRSNHFK